MRRSGTGLLLGTRPYLVPWLLFTTCLITAGTLPAGAGEDGRDEQLARELDDYLTWRAEEGYAGSVLFAKGDQVLLAKGYGLADRAAGRPNRPETLFDVGSVAKQFTAAAILRLELDGKLARTDRVTEYFGEVPEDKRAITIHHLLQHSSGLEHVSFSHPALRGIDLRDPKAVFATVLRIAKMQWPPGGAFSYSNTNYCILAGIVQIASERPFERYLQEALFRPSGMRATGSSWDADIEVEDCAVGYAGEKTYGPAVRLPVGWGFRGATGVVTNVHDLHRWMRVLQSDRVLSAEARRALFTPGREGYAYGWRVDREEGVVTRIHHQGTTLGFHCGVFLHPVEDLLLVIFSNEQQARHETYVEADEIVSGEGADVLRRPHPIPPEALQAFAGTYRMGDENAFEIEVQGGQLRLVPWGVRASMRIYWAAHWPPQGAPRAFRAAARAREVLALLASGAEDALTALLHRDVQDGQAAWWIRLFAGRIAGARGTERVRDVCWEQGRIRVALVLRHARGVAHVRILWDPFHGRLVDVAFGREDSPLVLAMHAESPTLFAGRWARSLTRIAFQRNEAGAVTGLTLLGAPRQGIPHVACPRAP